MSHIHTKDTDVADLGNIFFRHSCEIRILNIYLIIYSPREN